MHQKLLVLVILTLVSGCGSDGPPTTHTQSAKMATLAERQEFLEQYISFRRTYETLDFDVQFLNGGAGLVAGPSEWDIRLIATVPAGGIPQWIPAGVQKSESKPEDRDWLKTVPTKLDLSGVNEWYREGRRIVGLDRAKRIVVYRLWAN